MLSESALFVLDTFQLIFYYIDKSFGNDSNLKGFTAEMLGQVSAAVGLFFMLRKILAVMGLLRLAAMLFKNKLQESLANYYTQKEIVNDYKEKQLPNAELIFKTAKAQFAAGEIDYLQWIMLNNQAITIKSNYLEALNQYNQSVTQLNYILYAK